MNIFMLIIVILCLILLIAIASIQPTPSKLSIFEMERRLAIGDSSVEKALERERLRGDVISLQRVLIALFLVIFVLPSVAAFGQLGGIVIALVVALSYGAIARFRFIKKFPQKFYDKFETKIFKFIKKVPFIFQVLRSIPVNNNLNNKWQIGSRAELQHLVDESDDIITLDEKKLIVNGLSFNDKLVKEIMTPRSMIDFVNDSEFLGPLTLDELHSGHSRLPVIKGDIDHIVGILNLRSLLTLDVKRSTTAEKAMEPKVYYIHQDQNLRHALAAFIKTRHQLFIVVNEFRETVGLLSLEDVIEALIGQKIVDEFDSHDDLRAVALRNPRHNNYPEGRKDV
jgi:CBS domain containing-hemolysin-like protein